MGLKEQRERKNKSKKKITRKYKQEKKRVTYTNEEKRENSKVKEYGKVGKLK